MAAVWWLRESRTVASVPLTLAIGMALSLLANWAGQKLWEKHDGSDDLLFNELMVWGYAHRLIRQRRLAATSGLVRAEDPAEARRQQRLLERLVAGMETRDPYLHDHSRRVARHSWMIAQRLKLPREEVARIRTAAALHDVGKTKTPKAILHKAGRLTDEEYRIIKLHPGDGAEMVRTLNDPALTAIVRHHHERLDGSGYPDGLAGSAIPLGARIVAVADTFDAITSARPYRAASPHKRAIDILREESGTRLDPDVVKAFCDNYAGRRPLAIWAFLASLPERLVSWISSSVGAAASAAKVVALSAVVGAAAATGSALGVAGASPHQGLRRRHRRSAPQALAVHPAAATSARQALARAHGESHQATQQRPRRHAAAGVKKHSRVPAARSVPSMGSTSTPVVAPAGSVLSRGQETAGQTQGGHSSPVSGGQQHEASKQEGAPKVEQHAPSHREEAPAAKAEEHKPAEAPAPQREEETSATPPASEGGGEEQQGAGAESSCGHGKSCEARGHNKG